MKFVLTNPATARDLEDLARDVIDAERPPEKLAGIFADAASCARTYALRASAKGALCGIAYVFDYGQEPGGYRLLAFYKTRRLVMHARISYARSISALLSMLEAQERAVKPDLPPLAIQMPPDPKDARWFLACGFRRKGNLLFWKG